MQWESRGITGNHADGRLGGRGQGDRVHVQVVPQEGFRKGVHRVVMMGALVEVGVHGRFAAIAGWHWGRGRRGRGGGGGDGGGGGHGGQVAVVVQTGPVILVDDRRDRRPAPHDARGVCRRDPRPSVLSKHDG